jgi:hypothetical protein
MRRGRVGRQIQSQPALPIWICSGVFGDSSGSPAFVQTMRPGWCNMAVLDEFFPTRSRSRAQGPTTCAVSCVTASRHRLLAWTTVCPRMNARPLPSQPSRPPTPSAEPGLGFGVVGLVMLRRRNDIRSNAGTVSIGQAALLSALRC